MHSILRTNASLFRVYCLSFMGKSNIEREICFTCEVGKAVSDSPYHSPSSTACEFYSLVVNGNVMQAKVGTNWLERCTDR